MHPGMAVKHPKFGRGIIINVKPTIPLRVDVRFPGGDIKTIQANWLEPA